MPIYEYKCKSCTYVFDARQSIVEEPLTICPQCNGSVFRVIGSVGVQFKGSGFYINDSKHTTSKKTPEKTPENTTTKDSKSSNIDQKTDAASVSKKGASKDASSKVSSSSSSET